MRLTHSVSVAAPPDTVWRVWEDLPHWPEWTPTITSLEVLEGDGIAAGTAARLKQPAQPAAVWRVSEVVPGASFKWGTRNMGMTMVGEHHLEPAEGGSRVTLAVDMSGFVSAILGPLLRGAVRRAIRQEAEGLKARAEAEASASPA